MQTSEKLFGLPEIDMDHFLSSQLFADEARESYAAMTQRQQILIRHAIRYGQMQMMGHIKRQEEE